MMKRTSKSRSGMAIVVALAFTFVLMILVVGMWVTQSNVAKQNRSALQTQQAYFAARAAIQHMLVKARLMPTEFYDGLAFMNGKNPVFSFTEYTPPYATVSFGILKDRAGTPISGGGNSLYALYTNTGAPYEMDIKTAAPRFVYLSLADQAGKAGAYIRLGSYYNSAYRFLASQLVGYSGSKQYQEADASKFSALVSEPERKKYLEYFAGDCNNLSAITNVATQSLQSLLIMQKKAKARPKDWSIINLPLGPDGYHYQIQLRNTSYDTALFPYTLEYEVKNISLAAMKELKKYGEEAIIIEVEGRIIDFKNEKFVTRQTRTQKITRTGFLP